MQLQHVYLGTADIVYPNRQVETEMFIIEAQDSEEALKKLGTWLKEHYKDRRDCYVQQGSTMVCPYIK